MDYLKLGICAILAGAIGGLAVYFLAPQEQEFGATTARTTITNPWTFQQDATFSSTTRSRAFVQGGSGCTATTSGPAGTLTATQMDTENCIEFTPYTYQPTLTFPASSTLNYILPNVGDRKSLQLCNATSTAVKNGQFTVAFGTGTNLHNASTSVVLFAGDCADIQLHKSTDTDIEVHYVPGA